jgi:hypothetical protein
VRTQRGLCIEPGKSFERKVWRRQWQRGQAYVGDRLFGQDQVFGQLNALDCVYVLRLCEKQTTVREEEEIPLSEEDQQSGVLRQAWAGLGSRPRYRSARVRLVWVKTRENNVLILAINLPPERLSAALVWLVYKSRWKVELFFRWIKCILGCRHWLAESANGCAIQLYLALIAALLLQLHFGRRPNKRMMELIEFHRLGIATDQELQAGWSGSSGNWNSAKRSKRGKGDIRPLSPAGPCIVQANSSRQRTSPIQRFQQTI